jgi:LytS/YehU family sensor histidine kinase
LDIESLRLGDRLKVEQTVDPGLLKALMPPFSFQPLVENAVQHGLYSSARAGRLQLVVRPKGEWLETSVRDDGQGVPDNPCSRRRNSTSAGAANELLPVKDVDRDQIRLLARHEVVAVLRRERWSSLRETRTAPPTPSGWWRWIIF